MLVTLFIIKLKIETIFSYLIVIKAMAQRVVDIRIIKGRRQEDIDTEAAVRLKIRGIAEKEYKIFIDDTKAELEAARKRSFADEVAIKALTKEAAFTINQWIHTDKFYGRRVVDTPVTATFIVLFRNEYDTPIQAAKRTICEQIGFEYRKYSNGAHRLLVPEVSIERQILTMMEEGWSPKDAPFNCSDGFCQTMVKYEVVSTEEMQLLGVRRNTRV